MKKTIYPASGRGRAEHGWLSSRFSFSFAEYYNPAQMHFGVLRVLNDDVIQAGKGFGMHPHENMEIVTIPLSGALEHRDSMGNGSIIRAGEVQLMSAGTGIRHSEFNPLADQESTLLQIWLFPKQKDIKPRYFQRSFDESKMRNAWQCVVSPDGIADSLIINQQAWFNLSKAEKGLLLPYQIKQPGNGAFIFVIEGSVTVAGENLGRRDAIGLWEFAETELEITSDAHLLLMDIPMQL
ncbi:MAG: pirin family protein [Bacteroidales bacterium]|nr:pirin family protein [Bacteroidales bacterium]